MTMTTRRAKPFSLRSVVVCSMAVLAMAVAGCSSKASTTSASTSTTVASTSTSYPADKEQLCAAARPAEGVRHGVG